MQRSWSGFIFLCVNFIPKIRAPVFSLTQYAEVRRFSLGGELATSSYSELIGLANSTFSVTTVKRRVDADVLVVCQFPKRLWHLDNLTQMTNVISFECGKFEIAFRFDEIGALIAPSSCCLLLST